MTELRDKHEDDLILEASPAGADRGATASVPEAKSVADEERDNNLPCTLGS